MKLLIHRFLHQLGAKVQGDDSDQMEREGFLPIALTQSPSGHLQALSIMTNVLIKANNINPTSPTERFHFKQKVIDLNVETKDDRSSSSTGSR